MKGRILVVDDEPRQRDILQMILESEGYLTTAAGNGRQALEAATEEACDVVLTDLKMPDMSGIQLLDALLKSQPNACVVLMTAHGSIDSAVEAMRRGAFDYLTKPLDKDALLLSCRALERSRLVQENRLLKNSSGTTPPERHRSSTAPCGRVPGGAEGGRLQLTCHLRRKRHRQG